MSIRKFILNVAIALLVFGGLFLLTTTVIFASDFEKMLAAFAPPETTIVATLSYQILMMACIVWLFGKSVGSGDLKDGAIFGVVIGFFIMAADAYWFDNLIGFPTDGRAILGSIHLSVGAILGMALAFVHGKGWGWTDGGNTADT